ncbi:hypothetical protein [Halalkalibacter akibai]|uniref:hypothetical protein n=1 Tax=Halalkalibacter akibai TaxID=1411 RepID=UPI0012E10FB3|nr:hypothetical protein [Halalkalibacter akibai]
MIVVQIVEVSGLPIQMGKNVLIVNGIYVQVACLNSSRFIIGMAVQHAVSTTEG